jgi:hypothetical protein
VALAASISKQLRRLGASGPLCLLTLTAPSTVAFLAGIAKALTFSSADGETDLCVLVPVAAGFFVPVSADRVLASSDRLQVLRVHTLGHTAQVVERQSFWDGADQFFVGKAMGADAAFQPPDP